MGTAETIKGIRERCLSSFPDFCMFMQDDGYFDPIHRQLCEWIQYHYEEYLAGNMEVHLKLGVVMPRGALKTTMVTKYFPVWVTLADRNMRTLVASNTISNARKKLADIRGLFDGNKLFQTCFPETLPVPGTQIWNNEAAELPRDNKFPESTFEAAGMKTKKTGTHYNIIVEDDTVAPDESEQTVDITVPSRETIEKGIGWHKQATSLMVPKGVGMRIVVTTRWAEEDLIHHVETVEHYKMFDMPAMDETGTPRFTNFYSREKLDDIRQSIGDFMFSCLYLNKPLDAGMRTFQDKWFITVPQHSVPLAGHITIAVDPAISKKDEACETSITAVKHCLHRDNRAYQYWMYDIAGHYTPFETVKHVLDYCEEGERWKRVKQVIIETVAYQKALKYIFRDELIRRNNVRIKEGLEEIRVSIQDFNSRTNKEVRIAGMQPSFQNGRTLFVQDKVSEQTKSQLVQFPHGKLVDRIDCFAMHRYAKFGERRLGKEDYTPRELQNTFAAAIRDIKKKKHGGSSYYSKPNFERGMSTGLGIREDVRLQRCFQN